MSNLYANEAVPLWNPVTDEYEQVKDKQEVEAIELAVEEGHYLELLKNSAGFQILESYLRLTAEDLKHKLTTETDFRKIRRLQEAVKAYTNVLDFVDYKIHEGRALNQKRTP